MRLYSIKYNYYEPPNFELCHELHQTILDTASDLAEAKTKAYNIGKSIQADLPGTSLDFDYTRARKRKKANSKTLCVVRYEDVVVGVLSLVLPSGEKLCSNCGSNPNDEPYCISAGPCPYCGHNI
jgi:hypothetical protein